VKGTSSMSKSQKKLVLTSPWKIGMLVALLLLVISFGVGVYLVSVYRINLKWLDVGSEQWNFDSFLFFKEMYPLAAGVIIISLFSYFVIASAVRRYKFYLDSGQDYRRMISLAKSIDDLTNPAQIARLSDYTELQDILRNYGDQIREISEELNCKEEEQRSIDLEMEIESLLQGESIQETLVEGKWWAPIFEKLENYVGRNRQLIASIKEESERTRGILGNAALSQGKVIEDVRTASGELLEIIQVLGELNRIATEPDVPDGEARSGSSENQRNVLKALVKEMDNSLHKLEDGGRVLHEFSEENNGLALNIALMAAKGDVGEHDMAQVAEKVRSTAERFKRLSGTVTSIAQGLLGNCYAMKEKLETGETVSETGQTQTIVAVTEIASKVGERSKMIQHRLNDLTNELDDVHELIQRGMSKLTATISFDKELKKANASVKETGTEEEISLDSAPGMEPPSGESSDLELEQSREWQGGEPGIGDDLVSFEKPASDGFSLDDMSGNVEPVSEDYIAAEGMESSEEVKGVKGATDSEEYESGFSVDEQLERTSADTKEEGWMEMPGHRWIKIDVDKSDAGVDKGPVEVEVREASPGEGESAGEPEPSTGDERSRESEEATDAAGKGREEDTEPIYDLFELGAVEYSGQTEVER